MRWSCAFLLLLACAAARAADTAPTNDEPKVQRVIVEDDNARVEELRVRGQIQRIVVTPKRGGRPYEIVPADAGRDLSAGPASARGAAGQRVWNVLSF